MDTEETFKRLDVTKNSKLSRYELMMSVENFITSDDPEHPDNWVFGNYLSKKKK